MDARGTRNEAPRTKSAVGVLVCLTLVVLGAIIAGFGLVVPATAIPSWLRGNETSASSLTAAGNVPVNASAGDAFQIEANNSPTIAANPRAPTNLVLSNRVDTPLFSCALHRSDDGGATWVPMEIPRPPVEDRKCFAPEATFGADGTLHLVYVTLEGAGNVPDAVWITSSRDGGRTMAAPRRILGPLAFQVRLVADPDDGDRLYLAWLQAQEVGTLSLGSGDNPIQFALSRDSGATWGDPVRVSASSRRRVIAPSLAVGRGGGLYLGYLDLLEDALDYQGAHEGRGGDPYPGPWQLVMARSNDGESWTESVVDPKVVPTTRFIVFLPQFPSVVVDQRSGRVYVAYADSRRGDPDVYVRAAPEGATRFGPPRRVNDNPAGDGTSQYLPRLAVAPNGRLDVVYFDRRADPDDVRNEVSLQSSTDGGVSFGPRTRLSDRAFDSRIGFGSHLGLADLGSRLALVSTASRALAVWPDTRAGTEASGKQDLAQAVAIFEVSRAGNRRLVGVGAAIAVAGVLLPLFRLRRRRIASASVAHPGSSEDASHR